MRQPLDAPSDSLPADKKPINSNISMMNNNNNNNAEASTSGSNNNNHVDDLQAENSNKTPSRITNFLKRVEEIYGVTQPPSYEARTFDDTDRAHGLVKYILAVEEHKKKLLRESGKSESVTLFLSQLDLNDANKNFTADLISAMDDKESKLYKSFMEAKTDYERFTKTRASGELIKLYLQFIDEETKLRENPDVNIFYTNKNLDDNINDTNKPRKKSILTAAKKMELKNRYLAKNLFRDPDQNSKK